MIDWVNSKENFTKAAKEEFASVADGWLAATAKALGYILVTQEVHNDKAKKRVPLPNVCKAFDVNCIDLFAMLRQLEAKFVLAN